MGCKSMTSVCSMWIVGKTKKSAEQQAAKIALEKLSQESKLK
ncbi:MAG: putative dsRNA-binding protein [Sweet potato little leaf phytoplasma]|nr:putative dsRNA-binding protein [Sweet potato little leaf phytoplasma]